MYGCPPDLRSTPTLSPAHAKDLQLLYGYARRKVALLSNRAATTKTEHIRRVALRDRESWQRIGDYAKSSLDGAQMIVQHRVPGTWRDALALPAFWIGIAIGAGGCALWVALS